MSFSNGLSAAQAERLDYLVEEAAEVIQAVSKIKRHGYQSGDPRRPGSDNRSDLEVPKFENLDALFSKLKPVNLNLHPLAVAVHTAIHS